MSAALDCQVLMIPEPTVNPLVFQVRMQIGGKVTGFQMMLIWNLFQKYAAANECGTQGKIEGCGTEMRMTVLTKRRLGLPRNDHPLD